MVLTLARKRGTHRSAFTRTPAREYLIHDAEHADRCSGGHPTPLGDDLRFTFLSLSVNAVRHRVFLRRARIQSIPANGTECRCRAGRFLYMSTRKAYDGEWVGGTPKCGEYRDMPLVRDRCQGVHRLLTRRRTARIHVIAVLHYQVQPQQRANRREIDDKA